MTPYPKIEVILMRGCVYGFVGMRCCVVGWLGSTVREMPAASMCRVEEAADRPTSKTVVYIYQLT